MFFSPVCLPFKFFFAGIVSFPYHITIWVWIGGEEGLPGIIGGQQVRDPTSEDTVHAVLFLALLFIGQTQSGQSLQL